MKRDGTVGVPATLAANVRNDLAGAEQLREVVRGEPDPPLRQIQSEIEPHRATEPGIGAALRRPGAFDQPAEHDAIAVGQARFEQAEDAHAQARRAAGGARHCRPARRRTVRHNPTLTTASLAADGLVASSSSASASFAPSGPMNAACSPSCSERAASMSRCRAASSLKRERSSAGPFQRLQRRGEFRHKALGFPDLGRRSDTCADRTGADVSLTARSVLSARARPAVPRLGRGPRSTARSRRSVACRWSLAPSRSSGCLSNASSVTGSTPATAACAASRAKIPAGVSASGSPPVSSTAIFQRINAAATRRAERRGPASPARRSCRPAPLRAARWRSASASSSALAASITVSVETAASACAANARSRARSPPRIGSHCRPHRFGQQRFAAVRLCQRIHRAAGYADARQQRLHGELRMARRGGNFLLRITRDQPPRLFVEIGVEAGQHDGAVRQTRDRRNQFGSRGNRSGRTGGDHRAIGLAGKPRGLRLDQRIAPLRGFDAVAFLAASPAMLRVRSEKSQRLLPILVEVVRHEIVEPFPRHAAGCHVVDQAAPDRRPARRPRPVSARRAACRLARAVRASWPI